ncbi:hypothetical protein THAOC_09677, partial [Thalassiosira oceanica]
GRAAGGARPASPQLAWPPGGGFLHFLCELERPLEALRCDTPNVNLVTPAPIGMRPKTGREDGRPETWLQHEQAFVPAIDSVGH